MCRVVDNGSRKKVNTLNDFMQKNKMNNDIQTKIKSYIEYLLEEESGTKQEQEEFLGIVPEHMRREILIEINSKVLVQNFIFNINFSLAFLNNVSYKLQEKIFGPGEIVFLVKQRFLNNLSGI